MKENLRLESENVTTNIGEDEYTPIQSFADNIAAPDLEDFNSIDSDSDTFTALDNAVDTLGQLKNIDLVPRAAYSQTVLSI